MSITYPLTLPSHQFQSVVWNEETGNVASSSHYDGDTQIFSFDRNRWGARVSLKPLKPHEFALWHAIMGKLRGPLGTFWLGPTLQREPAGTPTGAPFTAGATTFGADEIAIDGCTPDVTDWLKAGDFFQIGNRLYLNCDDADTDSSGETTLTAWPKARSHSDNSEVITDNPKGVFRLVPESVGWTEANTHVIGFSFVCVEAL